MVFALAIAVGVRRVEDLVAWQLAVEFKQEVYRLLRRSPAALGDYRYRSQLREAVASTESNLVEGFHRHTAPQFIQFLSYARGSHAEAETRLKDGIAREYFSPESCSEALQLAKRCGQAILKLIQSLKPFVGK